VVEGGLGDVGLLGDVLQAHPLVAVLGEDLGSSPDDLGLAPVAAPLDPGRRCFRHWMIASVASTLTAADP